MLGGPEVGQGRGATLWEGRRWGRGGPEVAVARNAGGTTSWADQRLGGVGMTSKGAGRGRAGSMRGLAAVRSALRGLAAGDVMKVMAAPAHYA